MDWLYIIKIFWASLSFLGLVFFLVILSRAGSVFRWKRALKHEIETLEHGCEEDSARYFGIDVIRKKCLEIFSSTSPEIMDLRDIPVFVTDIASCFYPSSERPELEVSIGSMVKSLDLVLSRFESITERPGFWRLRAVRIRHLKDSVDYYSLISESFFYKWYQKYRNWIQAILKINLYLVPDPFSWLAYLSRRLLLLMLTKCLLADIYLFVGKLALNAYDLERQSLSDDEKEALESALEGLSEVSEDQDVLPGLSDPELVSIRKRFTSIRKLVLSNPTYGEWKAAIIEAAGIIAKKHFTQSERAIDEAALGPLVGRMRHWLGAFRRAEDYPMLGRFYGVRLRTLKRTKDLSNSVTEGKFWPVIDKAGKAWVWLKWPWKAYRLAKKASPWGIAAEIGWFGVKKAGLAYLCQKTFTLACFELDQVYRESCRIEEMKAKEWLFRWIF